MLTKDAFIMRTTPRARARTKANSLRTYLAPHRSARNWITCLKSALTSTKKIECDCVRLGLLGFRGDCRPGSRYPFRRRTGLRVAARGGETPAVGRVKIHHGRRHFSGLFTQVLLVDG